MRTLSLAFRKELFAQESAVVAIMLLTITHPQLSAPILISTDPTERLSDDPLLYGTTSRGGQYLFAAVEVTLPDDQDKNPPASKLIIPNVTRNMIPLIRSIDTAPKVLIEVVTSLDPDAVEFSVPQMDMLNVQYDALNITFELGIDALTTEPFPGGTFSPAAFPGLAY